jgi:hypothetical protein
MRRRLLNRLDGAPAKAGAGLVEADAEAISGDAPTDEDDVTVCSADTLSPKREVVDADGQALTTLGACHGSAMIRATPGGVNLTPSYLKSRIRMARKGSLKYDVAYDGYAGWP